ncbi:putative polypeptide deformylase-like protein [Leptomonas pyrrhocoris]|uniref:Peptide deformylase n=1 Tax=Leptomonas pyrrhocoris TaxID=157538 RepID=A0A0N0DYX6_LEPPY|nr:putative polypeptide deformylase-like protein [Leptomonas pyrrhocoris]KPA84668.1 putative polypeptide deformylase-like protein [Leptomonas pyrrhocoris]|eukprot:XP_015663107.1 putative polypeptide deformylase-like protein [Leptomonas pyrrhocoris]
MLRRSNALRVLVGAATTLLRYADPDPPSASASKRLKDTVEESLEKEGKALGRVACYPHRCLTRPVLPVSEAAVRSPLFMSRLMDMSQLATNLHCISFSAPKAHWDAAVILIKNNPYERDFEVWVNPSVPGYDDRDAVAPMYGMWENCISCGSTTAWVVRPQRITCRGLDQHGNEKIEVLDGMRARCLMHEMDHLMGKTIFHQTMGPEFVVSTVAMGQRNLWPANFPSAEAYVTLSQQFFDYVTNTTIIPPGMEWWYAQNMAQEFHSERLGS